MSESSPFQQNFAFPEVRGSKQDKGYATFGGIAGSRQWAKAHCHNEFSISQWGQVYTAKFRVMRKIMLPKDEIT